MSYDCSLVFQIRTRTYRSLNNVTLRMFCDTCVSVLQHRQNLINVIRPGDPRYNPSSGKEYTVSTLSEAVHTYVSLTRLIYIHKFGHHTTCASLATSANRGCHVCQKAWSILSSVEKESLHAADSREGEVSPAETPALAFVTTAELRHWTMPNTFSLAIRYNPVFVGIHKWNMFILEPDESKSFHSRTHSR